MKNTQVLFVVAVAMGTSVGTYAADEDDNTLTEVVVTAQRRSENPQGIPIAITALQSSDLTAKGITSFTDLQFAAPSVTMSTSTGTTTSLNIRGVGIASGLANVANGVAVYVDGVTQPQVPSNTLLYDIKNVEILRGPQGTLVGNNSTGGALMINTQDPQLDKVGGYVRLGAANYRQLDGEGAINLPVNDILALRASGSITSRDSFYHSDGPVDTHAGELQEKSGRLGVLFQPGDFRALVKVEYTDRNTGGYTGKSSAAPYAQYAPSDPFTLSFDTPEKEHETSLSATTELRYQFSNEIVLRSVSGYQDNRSQEVQDYDGTAANTPVAPSLVWTAGIRDQSWYEEINALSAPGGVYDWVTGAVYQRIKIGVDIVETGAAAVPVFISTPQNSTTTGVFGQVNYRFAPQWELGTGVRYSAFKSDGDGFVALEFPPSVCGLIGFSIAASHGCQFESIGGSESDSRVTGKVSLNYKPDAANLIYAFVARGYKPGGFTSPTANFNPETVLDFELGWKANLADDHVRTQLGGFYYKYHDFQYQTITLANGAQNVANLPTATIYGAEASTQLEFGGLGLDAGAGYVHSFLPSAGPVVDTHLLPPGSVGVLGPQCQVGGSPACFNYAPYSVTTDGGPNLFSPKWTLNAGAEYRIRFTSGVSLTPRVNYAYVASQYAGLTYSKQTDYLPAYGILGARLTLRSGPWTTEAYGTNLADRVYAYGQIFTGSNAYTYGAPRQFGVHVTYEF
jgi:iron complex outermembrane recepter protein